MSLCLSHPFCHVPAKRLDRSPLDKNKRHIRWNTRPLSSPLSHRVIILMRPDYILLDSVQYSLPYVYIDDQECHRDLNWQARPIVDMCTVLMDVCIMNTCSFYTHGCLENMLEKAVNASYKGEVFMDPGSSSVMHCQSKFIGNIRRAKKTRLSKKLSCSQHTFLLKLLQWTLWSETASENILSKKSTSLFLFMWVNECSIIHMCACIWLCTVCRPMCTWGNNTE